MITIRFQDTIYGQQLARDGRASRRQNGKRYYEALKALYVDMPDYKLLAYAEEAELIKPIERCDIEEYLYGVR